MAMLVLQVVELRVSIHCRGCEGKVRKHISKMEGVTSFSIDLATKKVTIIGDVTPLGVLTSVSKVKNAQFWPSLMTSSSSSASSTASLK
ncbi:Heavy metal-associated domain, HMA [Dillenia turbinata]|uniref:Heavy metal-associated domain, HMA n=1 Tax=Dillenia turbinata TaxID=194707 RepID=A0AAN8Z560_9MAGN